MIRTLIVDDEPLARAGLRALLATESDIKIVGEAPDGLLAAEAILSLLPDLVLLDVQMPGMDGIEVVRRIASDHLPAVIFITAHDAFAIQAFEVNAVDYLLKPPSRERLLAALDRARRDLSLPERPGDTALAGLVEGRSAESRGPLHRIAIKEKNQFRLLRDTDIDWIGAAGNYVEIHAGDKVHLLRETLADLARRLDPERFRRIHRSTLVNLDRIREISPEESGDFQVQMESGAVLRMSRRYRDQVIPRG